MKLINTLPEVFEEFNEQRKKSFVTALEMKEKGIPFVGAFCTYLPQEIPMAMGASVVGLCSMSGETIPEAEKDLPRNLCPLVKSSYGFAKTDKCPYFYFSDLIVGETTCDGKKKMYEMLGEFKPVYVMELPNSQSPDAFELWKKEVIKFKEKLESHFGVTITDEQVRQAARIKNAERAALREFYELMKLKPAPMLGQDLYKVLYGATFKFDKEAIPGEVHALVERIKAEYEAGGEDSPRVKLAGRPRILVTGSPIGGVTEKVIRALEDNGAQVVVFENCSGAKAVDEDVDVDAPDIYEALARRYLNIGCSCMTPNPNRIKLMGRLIDEYQVDAVVDVILQACHTYNVESYKIRRFVTEEKGIPYLSLETDYSTSDVGQLNTRMAAFVEML
ncbi:MAG TPA: 2-hydroxyacyl-CoA dehydratase [Candidatus Ventrousia excrementavium]|uniref:2-hydroxyacyl-CoA dehydratase n=1 Tax=Candidatus Ventrousia excrementavium TaxID=2840961 RepID=A0A9D1S1U8_9CLOT|nr:2-hydroxyacyl-CoA dehydratase [Candidatus Ventrousia excrementavium]